MKKALKNTKANYFSRDKLYSPIWIILDYKGKCWKFKRSQDMNLRELMININEQFYEEFHYVGTPKRWRI